MEVGAGINFAIIAKFISCGSSATSRPFNCPSRFIKRLPPPHFQSHYLPLSRPCREPPPCPEFALRRLCHHLHTTAPSPSPTSPESPLPEPPIVGAAAAIASHFRCRRCLSLLSSLASYSPLRTEVHCRHAPTPLASSPALHRALLCLCRTPESLAMVRTRGGHRYRPRVQFSTPERDGTGISRAAVDHSPDQVAETPPALAPASMSEEAQASEPPHRRYQTRVGPRAPSLVHPRPRRRAPPSKHARTSSPGESSWSRPE